MSTTRRLVYALSLPVALSLLLPIASAQQPELLQSPGFERVDDQGWAVGWERWPSPSPEPGAVSLDANMPFRGEHALRLHHERASSYTRGQQAITVERNQRYYFSVWVKGEGITPGPGSMGARLYVEGIGGKDSATERQVGTFDWKQLQIGPFDSGDDDSVTVMCYLHEATGTVWYDDVQVIKATADFEQELRRQGSLRRLSSDILLAQAAAREAGDEKALAELAALRDRATADAMPDHLDRRAGPPYFPLHADLLRIMARLNARRLTGEPVVAWSADPFAPLPVLGLAPDHPLAAASVLMGTGERDQAAVNLCNLTDRPLRLRVTVEGLAGPGAPKVSFREVVHIEADTGTMLADALPRLPKRATGFAMTLPSGLFRQLWLDVSSTGARPGTYRAVVTLRGSGGVRLDIPLTVEVLPVALPADLPITTWNYSYQHEPLVASRWEQARTDLAAHHINAYCWPSWFLPWPQFDADGKLLPLDWTAFDAGLKSHDDIQRLLLWPGFEWEDNLKLRQGLEVGSPLWEERFILWFRALIAGLKERGFGYDRIAWYLTDEPTEALRVGQTVAGGEAIRKADPQARIVENPYGACTQALLDRMLPVVDIWCPELTWGTGEQLPFFSQVPKPLWTYQVLAKTADPFARQRLSFWQCWRHGITGQGFWAYGDCGGSNWDPSDAARDGYAVVYDGDPEELVPSKRWEAWREGVEDYTYLWLLQQAQGDKAASLLRTGVENLLARPTPDALAVLREQVLRRLAERR